MTIVPHTAMVLAAGLGTRMRPLTDTTAKPLIKVGSKALIDHLLDPLVEAGVKRAIVNVHWHADLVEAYVGERTDIEIIISDERPQALETGGGLALARPHLGDDPVFVINTDAFWGRGDAGPLIQLAETFDSARMDALLLVADKARALGFPGAGDFFVDEAGKITRRGDAVSAPWAYAGIRIIKPSLYDGVRAEPFSALKIWQPLIESGRLCGSVLDDFWLHVGTPDALEDAQMWLRCYGR